MNACSACGRAFVDADDLVLHRGRAHDEVDAAYLEAEAREEAFLAHLRRHVRGGLQALPVLVSILLVLLLTHLSGIPIGLGLLVVPGGLAFAAVLYYMGWLKPEPA